jgi:hypothetical protein
MLESELELGELAASNDMYGMGSPYNEEGLEFRLVTSLLGLLVVVAIELRDDEAPDHRDDTALTSPVPSSFSSSMIAGC